MGLNQVIRRQVVRWLGSNASVALVPVGREGDGLVVRPTGTPIDKPWHELFQEFEDAREAWRRNPLARRLVGLWPALAAALLIAFDPFHIALSRFLHPDSLLSTMMLLATVAFLAYLYAGRRTGDLIAAGVYTAIAWLTKTPAIFLLPLVGLLTLIELSAHITSRPGWRWGDFVSGAALGRLLRIWLVWGSVTAVTYVALWPAMWVAPATTLGNVLSISSSYATEGHTSSVFFNGRIYNGDPGFWFYPINYLWRTTPVVMVGLALFAGALVWRMLMRIGTLTSPIIRLKPTNKFTNDPADTARTRNMLRSMSGSLTRVSTNRNPTKQAKDMRRASGA